MLNYQRYRRVPVVDSPECTWLNKEIMRAPIWCSMDPRDGNQTPVGPMVVEERVEAFNLLVKLGFKEIEVGFPAVSQIEYDFLRTLVEHELVPDNVEVQVLVQCREHLTERTFETPEDIKKAIVHICNFTFVLRRDMVSHEDREDIEDITVINTKMARRYMAGCNTQIRLEYSPESSTGTELGFTPDICTAVQETWGATEEKPIIINLPSMVEMTTPNMYADQIEWMDTHFKDRESITPSIHPHSDRGEGVAPTESALFAGTNKVEGTLFDSGEHTGNVDMLTVAYNMFSQGISPELDVKNTCETTKACGRCTKMDIPPRHPYAGKLVFTVFSGSHQDAINKGMQALRERNGQHWEVLYPPIDSGDIGREYKPIVRINSQSGKGDVAFVMDTFYGFELPRGVHKEFADVIQKISKQQDGVVLGWIMDKSKKSHLERKEPMHLGKYHITDARTGDDEPVALAEVTYSDHGIEKIFEGVGNEPTDAIQRGMEDAPDIQIRALDYSEYASTSGSDAKAVSYIHLIDQVTGRATYDVSISSDVTRVSTHGIFSVVSRLFY